MQPYMFPIRQNVEFKRWYTLKISHYTRAQ